MLFSMMKKNQEHIDELEKICIHAAEIDMPLEFNLLGYKAMRHYPSQPFIDLCKKHHNRIIIGTDAHEPSALKKILNIQSCLYLLKGKWLRNY